MHRRTDGQDNALGSLVLAHADLGEPRKAIDLFEQQSAICVEIGDRRGEGNALWNAALAYEQLDEEAAAVEKAKQAWAIRRAIDDPNGPKVADWLRSRGIDPDSV